MRTLVIGYGNPSRQDDGVGLAVVNGLRDHACLPRLDEGEDGFESLGGSLDTLFLQQLSPELAETLAGYDHVCLVDAHFGLFEELVHVSSVEPADSPALVSHHFKPAALLYLTRQFFGRAPSAGLISVRGFSFDFTTDMSPQTARGVSLVISELWQKYGSPAG